MLTRRSWLVYGALLAIWASLIGWQVAEHLQFKRLSRTVLINRANNTSSTLASVVRSLSFYWGVIEPDRLEYVLNDLVKPGEFHPTSVLLLNATNGHVASAGAPIDPLLQDKVVDGRYPGDVYWDDKVEQVMLLNLVDLGTNIVAYRDELPRRPRNGTNSQPPSISTNLSEPITATNLPEPVTATNPPPATNIESAASGQTNAPVGQTASAGAGAAAGANRPVTFSRAPRG